MSNLLAIKLASFLPDCFAADLVDTPTVRHNVSFLLIAEGYLFGVFPTSFGPELFPIGVLNYFVGHVTAPQLTVFVFPNVMSKVNVFIQFMTVFKDTNYRF